MIKIYPYQKLGYVDHGWLEARHHFSFASYYNPNRINFGSLRVINDDIIKANSGFDIHSHENMEIITYVRSGSITHKDNQGNGGKINAGKMQVMSAGSGIEHSEFNLENIDTNLYQIWIRPNKLNVKPRWDDLAIDIKPDNNSLKLLVSNEDDKRAPLFIYQDAKIYIGIMEKGAKINHHIDHQLYILISKGMAKINNNIVHKGDGIEVININNITIEALESIEIIVIDVPN